LLWFSGGRRRQIYTVTAKGRRHFETWLHEPSALPQLRDELKLKFFLTSRRGAEDGLRLLNEYGEQQRAHLAMLQESELVLRAALSQTEMPADLMDLAGALGWPSKPDPQEHSDELLIFYLTLRSGVLVAEARVAWVEESLVVLKAGKLPLKGDTK